MEKAKLWSRSLIVLMELNFCSALSFYLIMVEIMQFAVDMYDVGTSLAGATISVYVISALLTRLFFGSRIDAWGVKRSVAIGSAINAVCLALYLVPMGFAPLMLLRAVHGFAFALMSGAAAAGAAQVIPPERFGEGIGYYSMMQALATGIGPFVAIALTNATGEYAPMFVFALVMAVLALASVALLDIPAAPAPRISREGAPARGKRGLGSLVELSVVPLASVLLLVYIGYSGILSFVNSYAAERGLYDAVSFYFVIYALVILATRPPVGRRVDRLGENSIIYLCLASLVVGFVVLALANNAVLLLVSAALLGFGIGATQSIIQAVIVRDTPAGEQGRANSTFFMSMDLGSGVGPVIIGAVIPLIGYSSSYLGLAIVSVLATVVYYMVHGRYRKAAPPASDDK